jgi:hypothetical protein
MFFWSGVGGICPSWVADVSRRCGFRACAWGSWVANSLCLNRATVHQLYRHIRRGKVATITSIMSHMMVRGIAVDQPASFFILWNSDLCVSGLDIETHCVPVCSTAQLRQSQVAPPAPIAVSRACNSCWSCCNSGGVSCFWMVDLLVSGGRHGARSAASWKLSVCSAACFSMATSS